MSPEWRDVVVAGIGLVGTVIATFLAWSKSKTDALTRDRVRNETVEAGLLALQDLAYRLVQKGNQTSADSLRAALADGKITKEEWASLGKELKASTLAELKIAGADVLARTFGGDERAKDIAAEAALESAVLDAKRA